MRKKMATVFLALAVAASLLGGCGEAKETGGRAEGSGQAKESGENRGSEGSKGTEKDSDNEENGVSEILDQDESEADEPERLVRPENLELREWAEYDESGNMVKKTCYYSDGSGHWDEFEYDGSGNLTEIIEYSVGDESVSC